MILVKLNRGDFEYDIHALVKAFFPKQEVSVTAEEKLYGEPIELLLSVEYRADSVRILGEAFGSTEFFVDYSDRTSVKNKLKQQLYLMLSAYTGTEQPWGTLTGIRPTKIPMKMLEEHRTDDEIVSFMKETYFTSREKIDLAISIAKREQKVLNKADCEHGFSLYIGIPFCPTTCLYCSFTSFPIAVWEKRTDEYLDALGHELEEMAHLCAGRPLNAVYIGGGTPTTLSPRQLNRLLEQVKSLFDLSACLEFTVEAGRPDSITREKLKVLRQHEIDRISINPQTMKQETLQIIGRHHTVEQTIESFWMAREMGFSDINMDLILGLPDESLSDVRHTMDQIGKLAPDNLTVHSLALKRAARLRIQQELYKDFKIENTQEHMDVVASAAAQMGLLPYYLYRQKSMAGNLENVGYALPGKEGVYNILMMEEKQTIVACGAGSISKRVYPDGRIERCENVKDVSQYIARIGEMIERKRVLLED